MSKAITKEFIVGLSNVEGAQKFTPRSATVNNVQGHIWVKRVLTDNAWVHQGSQHIRKGADEVEVECAFESAEVSHGAVDAYWDSL